jgi:hypothetical protein
MAVNLRWRIIADAQPGYFQSETVLPTARNRTADHGNALDLVTTHRCDAELMSTRRRVVPMMEPHEF